MLPLGEDNIPLGLSFNRQKKLNTWQVNTVHISGSTPEQEDTVPSQEAPQDWLCSTLSGIFIRTKALLHFYCFFILQNFKDALHNVSLPQAPTPPLPCLHAPDWCRWQPRASNDNNCDTHFSSSQVVDSLKRNIVSCQKTGSIPHWMFLFLGYRG